MAPAHAVLATNSAGIPTTQIANTCQQPERVDEGLHKPRS